MKEYTMKIIVFLLLISFLVVLGCDKAQHISSWERHCGACHDGKTMLNGKVALDREQMKAKYKSLDEFSNACGSSPSCMNILKHEEKLLRAVGKELGIQESVKK
jgi:hypothetical protein